MNNKQQLVNWVIATLHESAWAPLSVIGFYFIGLIFHLYQSFPPLDIPTHFMGGVAIAYFYRSAIRNSQKILGDVPLSMQVLLAFTCTGTTTILWEYYEYLFDHFFGTHWCGLEDNFWICSWVCARSLSVL
jgi:hypothetical protein